MSEPAIFDTIAEVMEETENAFVDSDILLELQSLVKELIVDCTDATATGNEGCGGGYADMEFELDGLKFNVSISLSEEEEIEH